MTVKRAPKVGRDHILRPQLEKELRDYFGVAA
jgi:hypothetical protein